MRFEGNLKTWNDERGFGFIAPAQGGEEIFVHVTAFGPRAPRPQLQQRVSFQVELGPKGRKRARNVQLVRRAAAPVRRQTERPAAWTPARLLAIPLFAVLAGAVAIVWRPPLLVAGVYAVASVAALFAYAFDKSAARRKAWRTPESTLHLLALAGGWPGALLAQQLLRHKSSKAAFRETFWGTVVLNTAGFLLACSPMGQALWAAR